MNRQPHVFANDRGMTVYKDEQPQLYKLAEEALVYGNATFTHQRHLWEVGPDGCLNGYMVIRPEIKV